MKSEAHELTLLKLILIERSMLMIDPKSQQRVTPGERERERIGVQLFNSFLQNDRRSFHRDARKELEIVEYHLYQSHKSIPTAKRIIM